MKVGDLVYHHDDWADKKPIVGLVIGFGTCPVDFDKEAALILFTDSVTPEYWAMDTLGVINESG